MRKFVGGPRHGETTLYNNNQLSKWANPTKGPKSKKEGYYQLDDRAGEYIWVPGTDAIIGSACPWR